MKQRIGTYLLALFITIITTLLVLLLSKLISLSDAASLGISILALIFTIVTSFKNELFPFRLSIFSDSLHLVSGKLMSDPSVTTLQVLLPISFFNKGYSEGIIETVKLAVKSKQRGTTSDFLPVMEVDMVAFVQQGKGINTSNMLGAFVGFVLEPKRAVQKFILFTPKVDNKTPPFVWQADDYIFEIYIQIHGEKRPKKYFEIKQKIDNNMLLLLVSGKVQNLFLYSEKYA